MPRKQKKYHYIYKTTCMITGKFYVGMHSTDNLDDGYLGSGKILGYSRKKYGDENHVREILEYLPSRGDLKVREKELVNEELLADPLNINLKYGGDGGWDHIPKSKKYLEQLRKAGENGGFAKRKFLSKESQDRIVKGSRAGAFARKLKAVENIASIRNQYAQQLKLIDFKKPGWTKRLRDICDVHTPNKWLRRYFPEIWQNSAH